MVHVVIGTQNQYFHIIFSTGHGRDHCSFFWKALLIQITDAGQGGRVRADSILRLRNDNNFIGESANTHGRYIQRSDGRYIQWRCANTQFRWKYTCKSTSGREMCDSVWKMVNGADQLEFVMNGIGLLRNMYSKFDGEIYWVRGGGGRCVRCIALHGQTWPLSSSTASRWTTCFCYEMNFKF